MATNGQEEKVARHAYKKQSLVLVEQAEMTG